MRLNLLLATKRYLSPAAILAAAATLLYSGVVLAVTYISSHFYLGSGTNTWKYLGSGIDTWKYLGSSTIYTTVSGQVSLNLAAVFAVVVIVVLLIGIALYAKIAQTAGDTSPVLIIVGAFVAAIIGILGVALLVSLLTGINFR